MTWTILVLVVAIALYVFGGMLFKHDGKSVPAWKIYANKSAKLVSIILLVVGVNRLGLGTTYYLTQSNPAILQEMAQGMQAQRTEDSSRNIKKFVRKNMDMMIKDAPVLGNTNATKTIFLFSDYSCPYCRRVHSELSRVLAERNDVRIVLKNFSIHGPLSDAPARAVIAAKLQSNDKAAKLDALLMGKEYFSQNDMKDQAKLGAKVEKNVLAMAKEAGLNVDQLKKDMNGEVVARELGNVRALAEQFQIGGTPYLIIQDKAFPGAIPYEQIVDALK